MAGRLSSILSTRLLREGDFFSSNGHNVNQIVLLVSYWKLVSPAYWKPVAVKCKEYYLQRYVLRLRACLHACDISWALTSCQHSFGHSCFVIPFLVQSHTGKGRQIGGTMKGRWSGYYKCVLHLRQFSYGNGRNASKHDLTAIKSYWFFCCCCFQKNLHNIHLPKLQSRTPKVQRL